MTKVVLVVRFQDCVSFETPISCWSANQKRSSKSDSSTLLNSDSLSFFLFILFLCIPPPVRSLRINLLYHGLYKSMEELVLGSL